MTIASCPKCDDNVRVPANASPKATVSCPLCQAEFELSEILDAMPPLLVVVGRSGCARCHRFYGIPGHR